MFWPSPEEGGREIGAALDHVTAAIGNRVECEIAVGTGDHEQAAERLLERGLELAIVKLGGDGVYVATSAGARALVPPVPIEVVCGLGAGDAFGGALCHALLSGWDEVRAVRFANAAGAIVASRLLCAASDADARRGRIGRARIGYIAASAAALAPGSTCGRARSGVGPGLIRRTSRAVSTARPPATRNATV